MLHLPSFNIIGRRAFELRALKGSCSGVFGGSRGDKFVFERLCVQKALHVFLHLPIYNFFSCPFGVLINLWDRLTVGVLLL